MNIPTIFRESLANHAVEGLGRSCSLIPNAFHVLSVGPVECGSVVHDALLDGPHFRLTIATDIQELWLVPKQEPVHLVILHHMLSESEIEDASWFAREWWPRATIMVIRSHAGLLHIAFYDENAAHSETSDVLRGAIERFAGTWHE